MSVSRGHRVHRWRWVVATCVAALAFSQVVKATGLPTLTTITIDGQFSDWSQVFLNPLQVSGDGNASLYGAGCYPTNPDRDCVNIVGTGRDITKFAWTYDANNIYTYVQRNTTNGAVMHYFFIMNLGADGIAKSTDRVLDVQWNSGANQLTSVTLYPYVPANPGGDSMVCPNATACPSPGAPGYVDGYSMPGSENTGTILWQATNVPGGGAGGSAFEVNIPWSKLGVPAGTPIYWHVACNNNTAFNPAIDNVGGPDGKIGSFGVFAMSFTPNNVGSAGSPGTVNYCHTISNTGQFADAYNYRATSSTGSGIAFYTDNGSCGPGTLIALDANGNGTFTDPGDVAPSASFDSNSDGIPDTNTLAAGASKNIVVQLRVPAGLLNGTDTLRATATSIKRPASVFASVTDLTKLGLVTLIPDLARTGTPGLTVNIGPHTLQNNEGSSDTFFYAVKSAQGWPVALYTDSGGKPGSLIATASNGSTWNGGATPNTGSVSSGGSLKVWLEETIPAGTVLGTLDVLLFSVASQANPQASATATDTLRVANALTLVPSYVSPNTSLMGPVGGVVYLQHIVSNNSGTTDTISLSAAVTPAAGYAIRWWSDPDADGNPSDGALITAPFTLPPFGGSATIITEIDIPTAGAGSGTAAATQAKGATASAQAEDDVTVQNLGTYSDPLFTLATRYYPACATVYAKATGQTPTTTTTYQLAFINPAGTTVSNPNLPTDTNGNGTSSHALGSSDGPGNWKVRLMQGATQIAAVDPFYVERAGTVAETPPASGQSGSALSVSSLISNTSVQSNYTGTTVTVQIEDPSLSPFLSATSDPVDLAWQGVLNVTSSWSSPSYPAYGTYTAISTWKTSCGSVLATDTKTFPVPPPAPVLSSPADGAFVNTQTPALTGTAQSNGAVSVFIDGALSGSSAGSSFSYVPPALSEMLHTWYATQKVNGVSSAQSATRSFTVDVTAPASVFTGPAGGSVFNAANYPGSVQGTASDNLSGVATVQVQVNGGAWTTAAGTAAWSLAYAPPADGVYAVTSEATDRAGNVETPGAGISFTYDATAPTSAIVSPTAGSDLNATALPLTISGTASDATSGLAKVELRINGGAWTAVSGTTSWTYSFTPSSDGTYSLQSRATDNAGNVEVPGTSVAFVYDATPPTSTITAPATGSLFNAGAVPVVISGSASDATSGVASVEISVNGGPWTAATGTTSWSYAFNPPADGTFQIQSRATDVSGNVETPGAGISVTYDATPPSSQISSPSDFGRFNTKPIAISGTAADGTSGVALVEISINGGAWTAVTGTGSWTYSFKPNVDGSYLVQTRATDLAGNVETPGAGIHVIYDSGLPRSFISSPVNGQLFDAGSLPIDVTGTATDATSGVAKVQVSINDGGWILAAGTTSWSYSVSPSVDGTYRVASLATNGAGSVEIPLPGNLFTYDSTPPGSSVASPLNGSFLNASASPIPLRGQASDLTSGVFRVDLSINGGAWAAADFADGGWSSSFSPPADGTYAVRSRATDLALNAESPDAGIVFTYDTVRPKSNIASPKSSDQFDTTLLPIQIQGTASDLTSGVALVEFSVNGGAWVSAAGTDNWTAPFSPTADGTYDIQSRATDRAGNVEEPATGVGVEVFFTSHNLVRYRFGGGGCGCTSEGTAPAEALFALSALAAWWRRRRRD